MLKKLLIVVAISAVTASAHAGYSARAAAKEVIELKDGSTLYIFKDGKMALEDRYGRASRMKEGEVLETKSGQKIVPTSDEVARLGQLLRKDDRSK